MFGETLLRNLTFVGLVAITSTSIYYWMRAGRGEYCKLSDEGRLVGLGLRLAAALFFACIILWFAAPEWISWAVLTLPLSVRWAGLLLGVCSFVLRVWALKSLGTNLTETVSVRDDHALVTTGPYAMMRHPLYTAFALDVAAVSIVSANWLLGLLGLITFTFVVVRTNREEQQLLERFGEEYQLYARRVPRFFFGPRSWTRQIDHNARHSHE